nr:MAG TPA: hypothetical protein [Caudoviricetes sp.]
MRERKVRMVENKWDCRCVVWIIAQKLGVIGMKMKR